MAYFKLPDKSNDRSKRVFITSVSKFYYADLRFIADLITAMGDMGPSPIVICIRLHGDLILPVEVHFSNCLHVTGSWTVKPLGIRNWVT